MGELLLVARFAVQIINGQCQENVCIAFDSWEKDLPLVDRVRQTVFNFGIGVIVWIMFLFAFTNCIGAPWPA